MTVILGLSLLLLSSCCTFCSKCDVPEIRIEYKAPKFKCDDIQKFIFDPMDRSEVYHLSVTNITLLFSNLAKREKQVENLRKIIFCYQETVKIFNETMLKKDNKEGDKTNG